MHALEQDTPASRRGGSILPVDRTSAHAVVRCPAGYRAVDFGYRLDPGSELELLSVAIKPRRLMKKVKLTYDLAAGGGVRFYAVCSSTTVR